MNCVTALHLRCLARTRLVFPASSTSNRCHGSPKFVPRILRRFSISRDKSLSAILSKAIKKPWLGCPIPFTKVRRGNYIVNSNQSLVTNLSHLLTDDHGFITLRSLPLHFLFFQVLMSFVNTFTPRWPKFKFNTKTTSLNIHYPSKLRTYLLRIPVIMETFWLISRNAMTKMTKPKRSKILVLGSCTQCFSVHFLVYLSLSDYISP